MISVIQTLNRRSVDFILDLNIQHEVKVNCAVCDGTLSLTVLVPVL